MLSLKILFKQTSIWTNQYIRPKSCQLFYYVSIAFGDIFK